MTQLSKINLYATSLDVLQAFQKVLQSHPEVQALDLVVHWTSTSESSLDLKDTSTEPGLLCRTIFSHLMPFQDTPRIELTSFSPENTNMRYADRFFLKAVSLKHLDYLNLANCIAVDGLLSSLCQSQYLPLGLETLRWFDERSIQLHVLVAFESFLEVLLALADLHVELLKVPRLPRVAAISHCKTSLHSLVVQASDSSSNLLKYEANEIGEICELCIHLRELSLAFPPFDVAKFHTPCPWVTCLVCVLRKPLRQTVTNVCCRPP